jgi:hypothetical protein
VPTDIEDIIMMVAAVDHQHASVPPGNIDFSFLPKALEEKCKLFIIRYHELNGFTSLQDILRHPEASKLIESDLVLSQLFKKSTSSPAAKRANEGFVFIATLILSTEILALGLSSWAQRYPLAHRKARAVLAEHVPGSRARLTARYLASLGAEGGSTEEIPVETENIADG